MKMLLQKRDRVFAALLALFAALPFGFGVAITAEPFRDPITVTLFAFSAALLCSSIGVFLGYSWGRWATSCLSWLAFIGFSWVAYKLLLLLFTWSPNIPSSDDPTRVRLGISLGLLLAVLGMITFSLTLVWLTRLGRRPK